MITKKYSIVLTWQGSSNKEAALLTMNALLKEALWKQFGAGIDMLENALLMCPESLWNTRARFWFIAFDCLYYLDYYLTFDAHQYQLPAPFVWLDADTENERPERIYNKEELLVYLATSRSKCSRVINGLTDEMAEKVWMSVSGRGDMTFLELLMYNLRHLQHHTGQLNLLLRQGIDDAPEWIRRTDKPLR